MELKIIRHTYNIEDNRNVIGDLYIDGKFFCHTLEDEIRAEGVKVMHKTAIPSGIYRVKVTYSPHFKRRLPLIYNKKDLCVHGKGVKWCGVRIHRGNTELDTSGCILVGYKTNSLKIWESAKAEKDLVKLLEDENSSITLVIENKPFTYEGK